MIASSLHTTEHQEGLGQSEAFLDFQERLSRVAAVERPVLLIGERGTGKELAARRLHYLSQRWQGALITLNCAALSPSLIASELFGHERGAFTGAQQRRMGRFEAAHGGTFFLDEIGSIPLDAQEKILRVVEYGRFERVGSTTPVDVDVRIVGATNADLREMVQEGRFKQDLLDRLAFEVLYLPPLRARQGDILLVEAGAGPLQVEADAAQVLEVVQVQLGSCFWPTTLQGAWRWNWGVGKCRSSVVRPKGNLSAILGRGISGN